MIQKLRKRFIATNMLLVSLVLLIVFSIQTFSACQRSRDLVYQAQEMALREKSPFGFEFGRPQPKGGELPKGNFPSVPIFSVEIDSLGQVIAIREGPSTTVSQETAQELVNLALSQNRTQGDLPGLNLSYLFRERDSRRFFAFADNQIISSTFQTQLFTSLLICALALTGFYLISRFLAKLSLEPVEQSWERQRQFVADASHELKTPLTVILANTDILQSHPSASVESQSKWIGYIQDEAARMKRLVDDLLFLAKSDSPQILPSLVPLQLDQIVTGSLLPFESVAFEAGVTLTEEITSNIVIQGNEEQLRRLVVILLDNAVKYAGTSGIVSVRLDRMQERPRLSVHNTGPAIPPEQLSHLFERFYRIDTSRDRSKGGYGLGLSIAKSIVDGHRGKLTVTSSPSDGTTFTVLFPKK